jgi:hypothetical protein
VFKAVAGGVNLRSEFVKSLLACGNAQREREAVC